MKQMTLPQDLRAQILREAQTASPRECCGLLEGMRQNGSFRVRALHPVRNLSSDPARFQMDPQNQFAAQKCARAGGAAIIGCYHSHPGGRAEPSAADRAGAGQDNFLWLIAADDELRAFVYSDGDFIGLGIGDDWVTSSE
jgi:proteasome lid subunit RPN8/RPN11